MVRVGKSKKLSMENKAERKAKLEPSASDTSNDLLCEKEELLYQFARLLRNTDGIPLTRWGNDAAMLLDKLRQLDVEKYEKLVW